MSDTGKAAIFISYAREDAVAADRIAEALRSHGLEVWFDQNELRGGEAWDQKKPQPDSHVRAADSRRLREHAGPR